MFMSNDFNFNKIIFLSFSVVGNKTIEALNKQDPKVFLDSLYKARYQYLKDIVNKNSKLTVFLKGWNNRMDDLIKYNKIY